MNPLLKEMAFEKNGCQLEGCLVVFLADFPDIRVHSEVLF
jgi:hypothetical protein